jgi:MinD superfamily P-loop ATPase
VVLVTEPTPFGLNDLVLAVKTVRALGIPFGVVINRAGSGDARVHEYCAAEDIEILLEIPDDRRVAEAYARGLPLVETLPELRPLFAALAARIEAKISFPKTVGQEDGRTDACA